MVGVAEPVLAGQADEQQPLMFDAHELVADLWSALGSSVEGQFFSAADWARARLEMWHADKLVRSGQPTANQWAAVQRGLDELLISPAVKRRAGIELRKHAADADELEAVSLVGKYSAGAQVGLVPAPVRFSHRARRTGAGLYQLLVTYEKVVRL